MSPSQLSEFLQSQKKRYLQDVSASQGAKWTVVMGNEAGDLDSAASSIGYAYLQAKSSSSSKDTNIIPLVQTAREDIRLRPENVHAFGKASLDPEGTDLLCLNDIPYKPFPSHRFVLVDHNRLLDHYKPQDGEAEVLGILDHHEDEGLHLSAQPRKIQVPTGSCSSLIVNHFKSSDAWIPELATLLLSALVVDTGGLKQGGKATITDIEAAQFLHPMISQQSSAVGPDNLEEFLGSLASMLLGRKGDVSHLSNRDLLRRDYKQYQYISPNPSINSSVSVGLSTVPVDLKQWIHKDPASLIQWMHERDLMIHGSLTTFHRLSKKGKMKHKRQQLWVIRDDVPKDLVDQFWRSWEDAKDLEVERMKSLKDMELEGVRVRAYKQGNARATRKVIAPLVKQTIENYLAKR